jgi:hypothetical protein
MDYGVDYGQYVKNPQVISHREFERGMTDKKRNNMHKEFKGLSDEEKKEKKNFFGDEWKTGLRVVHSVNEKKNEQRRRDLKDLISSLSKD